MHKLEIAVSRIMFFHINLWKTNNNVSSSVFRNTLSELRSVIGILQRAK